MDHDMLHSGELQFDLFMYPLRDFVGLCERDLTIDADLCVHIYLFPKLPG